MMTETKTRRSTSYPVMRFLLTFTVAVVLLGLPGISSAFSCPLMTPAEVQSEPCSHCPDDKQDGSCPVSACLLICPYTVEKSAVLASEGLTDTVMSRVQLSFGIVQPPLSDALVAVVRLTRDFDSRPLYLLNRVLLI